jgi:quercetin dioxygenase-like cupin family protein
MRSRQSLLFGGDLSLQPIQRRLLFESANLPIQCFLEHLSCGRSLERLSTETTEEIVLLRGELGCGPSFHREVYVCLPPHASAPPFCARDSGAVFLRLSFESGRLTKTGQKANLQGKPQLEIMDFTRLAWNEIPARRENDPGARTTELSTNPSRTRITTLMDCRSGWHLHDHDHPSDVLTFCIIGGGVLGIEQHSCAFEAGHLVAIPAGVRHRFETGPEGAFLVAFVFEPFLESSVNHS